MKLLLDMNISPRWVDFFQKHGIYAVHWTTLGSPDAADSQIMAFACEHEYVVFTHDLDFSAILAASGDIKPSVIQLRTDDISPEASGAYILTALQQLQTELEEGVLLTIDTKRSRVRVLPL